MTRLPPDQLARFAARQDAPREIGVPLYLPAFAPEMLGDGPMSGRPDACAEADFGVAATAWSLYDDEDDADA